MALRVLETAGAVAVARGAAVVVAPAAARETVARAVRALLVHTHPGVPLLVADSGDAAGLLGDVEAAGTLDRDVFLVQDAATAPEAWNRAVAVTGRADLALVHPDAQVGPDWLEGLVAALGDDQTLATATAVSNHGAFATVPRRNLPWALLPTGMAPDEAAARLREGSARVHPRIPTALAHAVLIRRSALDLIGPFQERLAVPQDALDAFCLTATRAGLRHVLADDVLVAHRGGAAADAGRPVDPVLAAALEDAADDRHSAISRAVLTAASVLADPSVTVDGRCLGSGISGSTVVVLELLAALHRAGARPRVLLPDRPGEQAERVLAGLPGLERLTASDAESEDVPRTAVVHRPWQVDGPGDLRLLDRLGERLVLSHHDLIAYRNPDVFPSPGDWLDYRRVTQEALGLAAVTLFLSRHVADDALADDLLPAERALVVPPGVDHQTLPTHAPVAPAGAPGEPFLACVGSRLRHKNVLFALQLLEALRERGWDGALVLAGRDVPTGSSGGAEAAYLAARPALAAHVVELGAVSEAGKAWLYATAAAVLAPSTVEGFGLVPFEAAAAGTPCLVAPVASFAELLPPEATRLVPWDAAASADAVRDIVDGAGGPPLVAAVRAAAASHTWDAHAARVLAAYATATRLPAPSAARLAARLGEAEYAYWRQRDALGPAHPLVDPEAPLLTPAEYKVLVAAVRGRRTRSALLGTAALLGRVRPR